VKAFLFACGLVGLLLLTPPAHASAPASAGPIRLTSITPLPNSTIATRTPTIEATFSDSQSTIPYGGVNLTVDGVVVSGFEGVKITSSSITYPVTSLFPLNNGTNNVTLILTDNQGYTATFEWNFTVNTTAGAHLGATVTLQQLFLYVGLAAGAAGAGFAGWIVYLKLNTRFTFRKYFLLHPQVKSNLVAYTPAGGAMVFLVVALNWASTQSTLPAMGYDYIYVAAIFIGLTAFAIDARRELARNRAFERAFAQFLFEMADAMRGGIDPSKAIQELAKTSSNILQRPLRIASDALRIGRPFDAVLREMAAPMPSPLIKRYAALIADASGVGGETALVVYRAAKDMDDFVKIEEEREKQLTLPVAVIYIAFAVLMAVLFALLYIAPSLGSLNITFIGSSGNPLASSGTSTAPAVPKLDVGTLHERFFQLMLINSLGTGAIIGAFTEGKARYGLLHALGMAAATTIAFTILTS
jgi:archaellum biogenesis protein FlaJ (TadC family)